MRWAMLQRKLRHVDSRVLFHLAWYVPPDGTDCYPSHATLADELDLNVGSVRRAIARLTDRGLVAKLDRRRQPGRRGLGTWTYRLAVDNAVDYRAPARARSGKGVEPIRAPARARAREDDPAAVEKLVLTDDERAAGPARARGILDALRERGREDDT
jgi:DNA-binding transcriptional MocR family regulator